MCQAGSDMLLSHFTLPFKSGWFCRLPNPVCRQCCEARMPAHGWPPYPNATSTLMPDPMHLALRRCLRLPLPITRARYGGQGARPTWLPRNYRSARRSPNFLPSCWPGVAVCLRGRGSELRAEQWGQKAEWFLSRGSPIPPHPVWRQRAAAAWTMLSRDATLVSALTCHGQPAHTVDSQHGAQGTGLDDLL